MNIIDLFEEYNVEYWTEGKNVGQGWINVQCPFCDDDSNHCGIRKKDFKVSCWRCGRHDLIGLLQYKIGCTYSEAKHLRDSLSPGGGLLKTNPPYEKVVSETIVLPRESTKHFPKLHKEYLRSRGFPPLKTIRKYKLRAVHTVGKYKFRIIIPIFMNHRIMSFTARDITDQQSPPYLHLPKNKSIIDPKNAIFNYDTIVSGGDVLVNEGAFDSMKLGSGAICTFGADVSILQAVWLKKKSIRTAYILYDNDKTGRRKARKVARIIAPLSKKVEIVELTEHSDPGELSLAEAQILKDRLGFNL